MNLVEILERMGGCDQVGLAGRAELGSKSGLRDGAGGARDPTDG